jgi:hypothetical protein
MNILFQHTGECSTTAKDPAGEVLAWDGSGAAWCHLCGEHQPRLINLTETVPTIYNSDNWIHCTSEKWEVVEDVPECCGMEPRQWCQRHVEVRYFVGNGGNREWPRQWFDRIVAMGEAAKFATIGLLNVKNFRSEFRRSLRDQLEAWLNDPSPRYNSPFSERQWGSLINAHVAMDAKRRASSIYWSR